MNTRGVRTCACPEATEEGQVKYSTTPQKWTADRPQRRRALGGDPPRKDPHGRSPALLGALSRDDFQRQNLVAFQFEKISKINRAAGETSGESTGNDSFSVLLFPGKRLARVFILSRSIRLPLLDRGPAFIAVPFVLDDGVFRKTLGNAFAVGFVCREVAGNGCG